MPEDLADWEKGPEVETGLHRMITILWETAGGDDPINVAKAYRRRGQFIDQYPEHTRTFLRMGSRWPSSRPDTLPHSFRPGRVG